MADDQRTSASMATDLAGTARGSSEGAGLDLPVLTTIRARYEARQPLAGARIALFSPPTLHFAALVDALAGLGAKVRWATSEGSDAGSRIEAAIKADAPVDFVQPGRLRPSPWDCLHDAFDWDDGGRANLIIDKDGSAARLIHYGVAVEDGAAPRPSDAEEAAVYDAIRRRLAIRPASYSIIATSIAGSAEFTALGVKRLRQIEDAGGLMFPAIDVSTGGLSGRAPDRDRVAMDKLAGLLARLLLVQIEMFSNGATYGPGLHRFPDRLKQTLSDCEAAAARGLAAHRPANERAGVSRGTARDQYPKA